MQGNLLRGIVNWSGASRSVVQGPNWSLCQHFQISITIFRGFFQLETKNSFYKQCWQYGVLRLDGHFG